MAKYIDQASLGLTDFEIVMCNGDYKEALRMLLDKIEKAPAADVVEVVRCKDCKHRFNYDICAYRGDNWFCGYGERREDNGH